MFQEILNHLLVWRFVTFFICFFTKYLKFHPWIYLIFSMKIDLLPPICQHLVSSLVSHFCCHNLRDIIFPLLLENIISYVGFLSRTFTVHMTTGEGGEYLCPLYHVHPLHRHLDISRVITAESSPLHIANNRTWTGTFGSKSKLLTTKLRALKRFRKALSCHLSLASAAR